MISTFLEHKFWSFQAIFTRKLKFFRNWIFQQILRFCTTVLLWQLAKSSHKCQSLACPYVHSEIEGFLQVFDFLEKVGCWKSAESLLYENTNCNNDSRKFYFQKKRFFTTTPKHYLVRLSFTTTAALVSDSIYSIPPPFFQLHSVWSKLRSSQP